MMLHALVASQKFSKKQSFAAFSKLVTSHEISTTFHAPFSARFLLYIYSILLQKQICCFNHKVVILVADKLYKYFANYT